MHPSGREYGSTPPAPEGQKTGRWGAVALIVAALLLVTAFVYVAPNLPATIERAVAILSEGGGSNSTPNLQAYSPAIINGSADISFPPAYNVAAGYALGLINQDRSNFSLGPVTLSPNQAGQQHADSMLRYGYIAHYDTQGFKPYMRYTLLGGAGAVFENVAFVSYSLPRYSTVGPIESDLKFLEYSMMYNDNACCNNDHRINILNPLHDRVSIGVAYNSTTLFFVEDFENYYVNLSVSLSKTFIVTMAGSSLDPHVNSTEALLAYDSLPAAETPSQLNSLPGEYDPGTIMGGVLPKSACAIYPIGCPAFQAGITAFADSWQFGASGVDISFSLSDFVNQDGPGVYTIYLVTGSDTSSAITSFSIFVR